MTYRIEAAVLSNEELYKQEGGEPVVWVVMKDEPGELADVVAVFFDEQSAHEWVDTITAPDRAVAEVAQLLGGPR